MCAAFLAALALIRHFAGLHNYWHWTIQFASERRTPQISDMLQPFQNYDLLIWLAALIAGVYVPRIDASPNDSHATNLPTTLAFTLDPSDLRSVHLECRLIS